MSDEYLKQYKIIELFEKNDHQEIHMATDRLNLESDTVVVINTIKRSPLIHGDFLEQARKSLKNMIHSHETTDAIVLVTRHCKGDPLESWLKEHPLSPDSIRGLTTQYLEHIVAYVGLNACFLPMLTDASQIVVQNDGTLCMSEMLFLDTPMLSSPLQLFDETRRHVEEVLNLFIEAALDKESSEIMELGAFVGSLAGKTHSLEDYLTLWKTFQNPSSSEQTVSLLDKASETPASEIAVAGQSASHVIHPPHHAPFLLEEEDNATLVELTTLREKKDPHTMKRIGLIAAIVLILLGIAGLLLTPKLLGEDTAPQAAFTWVKQPDGLLKLTNTSKAFGKNNSITDCEWKVFSNNKEIFNSTSYDLSIALKSSGNYVMTLRVRDKNRLWSSPHSEKIAYEAVALVPLKDSGIASGKENLSDFKITFDTPNLFFDSKVFNSGNQSIRAELGKNGQAGLTLSALHTPKDYVISFWTQASEATPYEFTLIGKKGNHLKFTKTLAVIPDATETWEMAVFRIENGEIDTLTVKIKGTGNVWLDDFQIGALK